MNEKPIIFAIRLLMPTLLCDKAMRTAGIGLTAIHTLADLCKTSRTATAIRYTQITDDPVAIVVSVGNRINYCFMSDTLREVKDLNWIRKNEPLPKNSATFEFNQNSNNVHSAKCTEAMSDLQDWFGGPCSIECTEEVVGLGKYGKTLTVLTAIDLPEPEEIEEEQALIESWQPRFRR